MPFLRWMYYKFAEFVCESIPVEIINYDGNWDTTVWLPWAIYLNGETEVISWVDVKDMTSLVITIYIDPFDGPVQGTVFIDFKTVFHPGGFFTPGVIRSIGISIYVPPTTGVKVHTFVIDTEFGNYLSPAEIRNRTDGDVMVQIECTSTAKPYPVE